MLNQNLQYFFINVNALWTRAFIQANCLLASCINTSTALGAKGIFIVAGAFFGARIFFALRIEATAAILAKAFALVMTRTFFLICMFAAGIIEAATAFGANFALLVRWRNEMTFAFFSASGILALCVKATAALGAKALTFVRLFCLKPLARGERRSHKQG